MSRCLRALSGQSAYLKHRQSAYRLCKVLTGTKGSELAGILKGTPPRRKGSVWGGQSRVWWGLDHRNASSVPTAELGAC